MTYLKEKEFDERMKSSKNSSKVLLPKKCVPCEGGTIPLTRKTAKVLQANVPKWKLFPKKIVRVLSFPNFKKNMVFVNKIAQLAENEGHHPDILIEYGKTTLSLSTHAIKGLSTNDFVLASKIDKILKK